MAMQSAAAVPVPAQVNSVAGEYGGGSMGGYRTASGGVWGSSTTQSSQDGVEGRHRGRGPKGYRRSDERIKEEVSDCLTDDPFIDASEIDVEVKNGEVMFSGTVDSRITKWRAEDLVEDLSGVGVQNNLRVRQQGLGRSADTSAGSSGRERGFFGIASSLGGEEAEGHRR